MSIISYTKAFFTSAFVQLRSGFGRTLRQAGLQLDQIGSVHTRDIAYLEPFNRHRNILPLYNKIPVISPSAYIAPNATVYGSVFIGKDSYFAFGSVAKGGSFAIRVGQNTKVGQNTVLDTTNWGPDEAFPLSVNIGNNVTIEQNCHLLSCLVDDDVHIGHRSVIMEGAQLQRGCVIAPNSFVPAGSRVPANTMWGGNPIVYIKDIENSEQRVGGSNEEQIRLQE